MSKKFYTPIDLQLQQALNLLLQNLASDPSAKESQIYYNTATHTVHFHNGTAWVQLGTLDQISAALAAVSLNNQNITNLADPVNAQDAVNLRTLLNYMSGLSDRAEVAYATTAALPANSYSNGSSGVGATLTATGNGALSIDGVAVSAGQRVLVKNEAAAANNGIYVVTNAGSGTAAYVLTRATDMDAANEFGPGIIVPVKAPAGASGGTVNDQKVFLSTAPTPFTVGTSVLNFTLVGSSYTADETTLHLSGTVFSLITPVSVANGGTGQTSLAAVQSSFNFPQIYTAAIGDGSSTAISVNHNLGRQFVLAQAYDASSGAQVECDITLTDSAHTSFGFAVAPASNAIRVVIHG